MTSELWLVVLMWHGPVFAKSYGCKLQRQDLLATLATVNNVGSRRLLLSPLSPLVCKENVREWLLG